MAATPHKPLATLQRWTNHLAIWVVLGGVAGVAQCRRRPLARPPRTIVAPGPVVEDLGSSAHRELVRHVVRL